MVFADLLSLHLLTLLMFLFFDKNMSNGITMHEIHTLSNEYGYLCTHAACYKFSTAAKHSIGTFKNLNNIV